MLNKTKLEGKTKEEILNKYLSENNLEEKDIFYTESEIKGGLLKSKKVELEIVSKKDIHLRVAASCVVKNQCNFFYVFAVYKEFADF